MLERLLAEIKQGSALDTSALARKLDVSPRQLNMMLETLEQMGRIQRRDSCADNSCGSCPVSSLCSGEKHAPILWMFTGEG